MERTNQVDNTFNWDTIIRSKTKLFDIPLKELWKYRNMITMLVKRNYQIQYKQSILGPLWIVLGAILSTGLFSFVFGFVGDFQSDNMPYFLFYLIGSVLFSCFSGCLSDTSKVFVDNIYLFGKVYFPRLVIPLANMITHFIYFLLRFVVCVLLWSIFFFKGDVGFGGWYALLLPIPVIFMAILGSSIGMIVSCLSVKYRDLSHMIAFGIQIVMYLAPIAYPLSQIPEFFRPFVFINPITSLVELFRFCITGAGVIDPLYILYSLCITLVLFVVSLVLYNQVEKDFIDIV